MLDSNCHWWCCKTARCTIDDVIDKRLKRCRRQLPRCQQSCRYWSVKDRKDKNVFSEMRRADVGRHSQRALRGRPFLLAGAIRRRSGKIRSREENSHRDSRASTATSAPSLSHGTTPRVNVYSRKGTATKRSLCNVSVRQCSRR